MNERDRRLLQVASASNWLASVARKDKQLLRIEPYVYNTSMLALTTTAQAIIQVQADSDFAVIELSGAVLDNASKVTIVNPPITMQVTDSGSGKTFFNDYALFSLVFGLAGFPYYTATPRIISPGTNIIINANSLDGTSSDVYVTFSGVRLYYGG